MKVLHIVPYLHKASGVTTFLVECSDELQRCGVEQLIAVKDMVRHNVAPSSANVPRIGVKQALSCIKEVDVVHIHGIWPPFMHRFVVAARRRGIPIVWSVHGMLSPWAMKFKWWKKMLPWVLWQKRDLACANVLHVTSEKEYAWVRALGFENAIVNIPLGTALPDLGNKSADEQRSLRVLFVGRINPVKGLDNLVRAAALLETDVRFRIVGTDTVCYQASLVKLSEQLGVAHMFEWAGPKYDEDLQREYARADALVLPSHTENFGCVVIDAMSWGLPVITSTGTPWHELSQNCGWWIDNSPEKLASAIRELVSLPEEKRLAMGACGRKLVERKYAWPAIAESLERVYDDVAAHRVEGSRR